MEPSGRTLRAAVDVHGVDFSYGAVQVLFNVSLSVAEGEIIALLGTNGAGKSTLLRVLCGLESPAAGSVAVAGQETTGRSVVEMVERGVVLVPGGKAVFPDLTVADNLAIGAYPLRRQPREVARRTDGVLALFSGLRDRLGTAAGRLSGGEQQQLALAKALLLEPSVLCIDELSLGLAPNVVERLLANVRTVNERGTTIILVEQSLNVAAALCERAVFMEKGAVRFEGRTADLLERDDVARAVFLGTGA
jgi:ABC-type branched-subunit amino acid transport system ATPase component